MADHYDVIVAGAGIGGLCAALRARETGASVAILEKADRIGGSAAASGGTIWCASTISEWLKVQPHGDMALGTALIDHFRLGIDWLIEQGVSLQARAEPNPYKFQRTIYQLLPDARAAMETLSDRFRARGGRVFTNTALTGLLGGNGAPIAGVQTAHSDWTSRAVILSTGGFQGNSNLRARYFGVQSDHMIVRGVPQNTGGGFQSALAAGAQPVGPFNRFYGHLLPAPPARVGLHNFLAVKPDFSEYAVLINLNGERFDDEYLGDEVTCHTLVQQRNATAILVFDQHIRDNQAALSQWPAPDNDRVTNIRDAGGEVLETPSLHELGHALTNRWHIPFRAFQTTMADYAAACASGNGQTLPIPKSGGLIPLDTPPYYAIRTVPGITFTYGGAKVNANAQILDKTDCPIPGLFAAGADCGGIYTRGYTGGLSMGLAYGLIAGKNAAQHARLSG